MICYFCQQELPKINDRYSNSCKDCAEQNDLKSVYTSNDEFAHIYIDKSEKVSIPIAMPPNNYTINRLFQVGFVYHIRLHLKENLTQIHSIADVAGDDYNLLLTIPGFPINPLNAKDKLLFYLTFL